MGKSVVQRRRSNDGGKTIPAWLLAAYAACRRGISEEPGVAVNVAIICVDYVCRLYCTHTQHSTIVYVAWKCCYFDVRQTLRDAAEAVTRSVVTHAHTHTRAVSAQCHVIST